MTQAIPKQLKQLYATDFALWVEDTIARLKAGDYSQVDWENLIDEVTALAGRDRRELESRLITLFEHALKRCYVPLPECYRGWEGTISRNQQELSRILRDSPSLHNYFLKVWDECYGDALKNMRKEYDANFPEKCPFPIDVDGLLERDFY